MRVATALPHPVRVLENIFIPMSDGRRLAAKVWMPEDAERAPVPVLMEYIPYRKRDFSARRDEHTHRHLAGHGYVSGGWTAAAAAIPTAPCTTST
jgi:uncharacterized protein